MEWVPPVDKETIFVEELRTAVNEKGKGQRKTKLENSYKDNQKWQALPLCVSIISEFFHGKH